MNNFINKYDDNQIKAFGYTDIIYTHIKEACHIFYNILNPISIILIGSSSRGELIYNKNEVFSDYEFYIIINAIPDHEVLTKLKNEINNYTNEIKNNILIDIDYSLLTEKKFINQRKRLITFDTKSTALTLLGKDVIQKLPLVTIQNIEPDDVDEIILYRLVEIFKGTYATSQEFKITLLKNLLYILTWSLIQDKILISGFNNRYNFYKDNIDHLDITNKIFSKNNALLQLAIEYRNMPNKDNLDFNLKQIFEIYSVSIKLLNKKNNFQVIGLTNKLRQIYYSYKLAKKFSTTRKFNIKWLLKDKRIYFTNLLWSCIQSRVHKTDITNEDNLINHLSNNLNSIKSCDLLKCILPAYFANLEGKFDCDN